MNDMNNNTQKFQIGDKVKVIKGIFKGEVGTVKCIADFRLYNRLTYRVRLDNVKTDKGYSKEEAFVSYELEKYDESVQNTCELNKNETCTKQKNTKVVYEFDNDTIKPYAKLKSDMGVLATKITFNDRVIKNRYGASDVIEKQLSLTLEEAQHMYNAGGELRKLALRVYTKDELHPVPCTWEEYCENAYGKFYYIDFGRIHGYTIEPNIGGLDTVSGAELLPSYELTEAVLTFEKLLILRNAWIKDWTPDWSDEKQEKYYLKWCFKNVSVFPHTYADGANEVMSFPTIEMARKFKDCFSDFLTTAKNLY